MTISEIGWLYSPFDKKHRKKFKIFLLKLVFSKDLKAKGTCKKPKNTYIDINDFINCQTLNENMDNWPLPFDCQLYQWKDSYQWEDSCIKLGNEKKSIETNCKFNQQQKREKVLAEWMIHEGLNIESPPVEINKTKIAVKSSLEEFEKSTGKKPYLFSIAQTTFNDFWKKQNLISLKRGRCI